MRLSKVLAVLILGSASSLSNAATIDFGINAPTSGGTLTYAGGAGQLIGNNIEVDNIVGIGTPANNNASITCDNCKLSFNSGNNTGGWNFGAGGVINVTGGVSLLGIANNSTLLTGTFDSASVLDAGGSLLNFKVVISAFTDTKHPDLLAYFGMPLVDYVGGLNLSFSTVNPNVGVGQSFNSNDIFSGDIVNNPVPVPAAVWLFGSGLIGLIGIARRKKS